MSDLPPSHSQCGLSELHDHGPDVTGPEEPPQASTSTKPDSHLHGRDASPALDGTRSYSGDGDMQACHTEKMHECMANRFRYHPLKTATSIRLLEFTGSASQKTLHYNLIDMQLDEAQGDYTALSYTWGDPALFACIRLNGEDFPVRKNIFSFLSQLAEAGWKGLLWADAICIDQRNTAERTAQVSIMGKIFHSAKQVKAWIGQSTEETDQFFDFVNGIGAKGLVSHGGLSFASVNAKGNRYTISPHANSESISSEYFDAVRDIIDRPYWSRLWIVQELFLTHTVYLHCGDRSILVKSDEGHNEALRIMIHDFCNANNEPIAAMTINDLIIDDIGIGLNHTFGRTIWFTGGMGCQEKHDRIYALMASGVDWLTSTTNLSCDYEASLPELLQRVATHCSLNHSIQAVLTLLHHWKLPNQALNYPCVVTTVLSQHGRSLVVPDQVFGEFASMSAGLSGGIKDLVFDLYQDELAQFFRQPTRIGGGRATLPLPLATRPLSETIRPSDRSFSVYLIELQDHVILNDIGRIYGGVSFAVENDDSTEKQIQFSNLIFGCCVSQPYTRGHSVLWELKDIFARWFAEATLTRDDDGDLEVALPINSWICLVRDLQTAVSRLRREDIDHMEDKLEFEEEWVTTDEDKSSSEVGESMDEIEASSAHENR